MSTFDSYRPATKWLRRAKFFDRHSWFPFFWPLAMWCQENADRAYTDAGYYGNTATKEK